jgi:drug/metabolite transporter (DMT)-like permease
MNSSFRSRVLLIVAAVLFSTGGAAIKATSLTIWQVASLRSGVAACALALVVRDARRGWSLRLTPIAVAYAATLILFTWATKLTTSANAIFLQDAAPLYVLLLGPIILHERPRRSDLAVAAAVCGGVALVLSGGHTQMATAPDPTSGNVVAVMSGLTWALTIVGLRHLARKDVPGVGDRAMTTVVMGNAIAALAAMPFAWPIAGAHLADLTLVLYLGLFQIAAAYVCLTRGIRHVRALEASTLLLIEPALNPLWTWWIHGESPGTAALAGGAVILGATLINAWQQSRRITSSRIQTASYS